ncbi:MAG: hypothetical protein GY696_26705, partial [Gammaproteobacteria bacterium]|nr:hypothetical protein [Gammaproteobacteria bacterium]
MADYSCCVWREKMAVKLCIRLTYGQTAKTRICQQQRGNLENKPVQIQPGRFGLANGNLYYQYNCWTQTAEIQELPECWTDAPSRGEDLWTPTAACLRCIQAKWPATSFFPLTSQTQEGWVAIMPHLVWQPALHLLP